MANRGAAEVELTKLNQQQIAFICGVTSRSVRDWADAPRNSDGTYNAQEFVAWFVRRTAGPEGEREYNNQRERLAAAQAEKVETENKVRRGELVDARAMVDVWKDICLSVRAKFISMPSKLGPQLVNISEPGIIANRIRTEVYIALDELADESASARDNAVTADADNIRVGGQIQEAF